MVIAEYTFQSPPKRVVKIRSSNAVIRVDVSNGEWQIAVADDQRFRRLFDIIQRRRRDVYDQAYSYYLVERKCRHCKRINTIEVTDSPGYPVGESRIWTCHGCNQYLAKIDAVRGRVSVRWDKTYQIAVTIADAIATMVAIENEDKANAVEAHSAGIPYQSYSFIPPVTSIPGFESDEFSDIPL